MKVTVIGAGLFGCSVALELDRCGHDVTLIEKSCDIMQHASQHNHSRVHAGYHYPRSLLTAQQSLTSMASFMVHFKDAMLTSIPNYYAIARHGSNVTTSEFKAFCDEAGLTVREGYPSSELLNHDLIDSCFSVDEPMFDYITLKRIVSDRLSCSNINVVTDASIIRTADGAIVINMMNQSYEVESDFVVNATYAGINDLNDIFGVKRQDLLYEDVTIPVIGFDMPKVGLTVMDGDYCTLMPHGTTLNEFLLYHVSASVKHRSRHIDSVKHSLNDDNHTDIDAIIRRSTEYMPFLRYAKRISCRRTIRTVHENISDARLSEIHTYKERSNYISILSGKISTCIQTAIHVRHMIENKQICTRYYL